MFKCLVLYNNLKIKINYGLIWMIVGAVYLAIFVIVGIGAAVNFDKTFEIFHKFFFPQKTNWLFDPTTDEIINYLPAEFFRNCFIFILVFISLLVISKILKYKLKERYARSNRHY